MVKKRWKKSKQMCCSIKPVASSKKGWLFATLFLWGLRQVPRISVIKNAKVCGYVFGGLVMNNAIILFASSRRNGNTGRLTDEIAKAHGVEVVDLGKKEISEYDYEHKNRNDDFEPLMEHILNFDKIIFASPIYWYAVAPPMKIFIDRISDYLDLPDLLEKGRKLRGKEGYVICTSVYDEPCEPFINAFKDTFSYLGMEFGGYINANCDNGYNAELYENDIKSFIQLF